MGWYDIILCAVERPPPTCPTWSNARTRFTTHSTTWLGFVMSEPRFDGLAAGISNAPVDISEASIYRKYMSISIYRDVRYRPPKYRFFSIIVTPILLLRVDFMCLKSNAYNKGIKSVYVSGRFDMHDTLQTICSTRCKVVILTLK